MVSVDSVGKKQKSASLVGDDTALLASVGSHIPSRGEIVYWLLTLGQLSTSQ
jgi:hypothetical protein